MENEKSVEERLAERLGWRHGDLGIKSINLTAIWNLCLSLLTESEEKDKEIRNLTTGECPQCDNSGSWCHQIGEEEYEQAQCEWCWKFRGSIFAVNETERQFAKLNSTIATLREEKKELRYTWDVCLERIKELESELAQAKARVEEMGKAMGSIRLMLKEDGLWVELITDTGRSMMFQPAIKLLTGTEAGTVINSIVREWINNRIEALAPDKEKT